MKKFAAYLLAGFLVLLPLPAAAALSINGTPTNGGSDTSGWTSTAGTIPALTTTTNKNLIVVVVTFENTGGPVNAVSSVSAAGLTFTRRSIINQSSITGQYGGPSWMTTEVWSAQQTSSGSTGTITIAHSGGTMDIGDGFAFAVNYDGASYPVWSSNGSLPATAVSTATSAPTVSGMATNNDALVLGIAHTPSFGSAMVVGAGYTSIIAHRDGSGGFADNVLIEYKSVVGATGSLSAASASSVQTWSIIGDAIEAPAVVGGPLSGAMMMMGVGQ